MAVRYVYRAWKWFWKAIFVLLLIILVLLGGLFIALQLDATKDTIAQKVESNFNKTRAGRLVISDIDGTLPFNAVLKDVYLIADTDSTRADTVAAVERVEVGINLWRLLQNELVINHLALAEPTVRLLAAGRGTYTLAQALESEAAPDTTSGDGFLGGFIRDISIMAPSVTIRDGSLYVEKFFGESKSLNLPEPFSVQSLNTEVYIELTTDRRFLDVEIFSALINGFRSRKITLSGQIYNDDKVLEFNAFNLTLGQSELHLNGEIEGINLYAGQIAEQLKDADYNITAGSDRLALTAFNKLVPQLPAVEEPMEFTVKIEGSLKNLQLQTFKLGIDDSYFSLKGSVENLVGENEVHYSFQVDTLEIHRDDITKLLGNTENRLFYSLQNLQLAGYAEGTFDTLSLNIEAVSPLGRFAFAGSTQLAEPYHFLGRLTGEGVDVSPFIQGGIDTTSLNFNAAIEGRNPSLTEGRFHFKGNIYNSLFGYIPIDSLRLAATLNNGLLDASYYYTQQKELIEGTISANFNKPQTTITLKGRTERLNLATILENAPVDTTSINTTYFVDLEGLKPDNISGSARFRVEPSVIGGDSVAAHQIAVKLSPATGEARTLAINSSLFDLQVTGDLQPTVIADLYDYWSNYFTRHITREILLDSVKTAPARITISQPVRLEGNIDFKNIDVIKNYLPSFPSVTTDGKLQFTTTASADRFEFSANIQADTLIINQTELQDADVSIEGQFQHDKLLKQFSNLALTANAKRLQSNLFDMDSLRMRLRFHKDSLFLSQHVKQFSDTSSYALELHSVLTDSTVTTTIENFYLGNYQYAWTENQTPAVTYTRAGEIIFKSFRFNNEETYLVLDGRLSPSPGDSLQVKLRDIELSRISSLLRKELNFDGHLDATLTASSFGKKPSVQGELSINDLSIKDHFIGKLRVTSNYNRQMDRLAARLVIESDTTIVAGRSSTPNVVVEGYYDPDAVEARRDSAFYFQADFNALDTWFLSLVLEDVFLDIEGFAAGSGYIAGNGQDLNYHAEVQLQDIFVKPVFVETKWHLNGNVRLDNENGIIIDYVNITDESDGRGTLYGTVNLNYISGTYLDLHLRLNELRALSSSFEPDTPFYGSMAASGTIHLVGPTDNLRLYSTEDLVVTRYSELGIPLITSTQVTEADEFIEFVDSFESPLKALRDEERRSPENSETGPLEDEAEQLSFTDRVNIDLQFRAPQPINVTLLFDPATGEKLLAEGTGAIRIIMQGGDAQLFGRFNVTGGTYFFVSGQIFQRELEIRPGGSIVFSGDPLKARLNIEAVYHARPQITSLEPGENDEGFSQSFPVDLVIEITGTINSIQQNYYFELPSFAAAPPRLQYRINQINSNEEIKLIQAASVLLSGEFIPVSAGSRARAFGQQITQSSTIVNPIISNQIVSPFLSDQINALLNSEVAEVDIDFQLNAYNEIDLGVALRLYNDRLILQRQGRLTGGSGSDEFIERLGNLSVVYRITPHLSVRAFHRQVPTLGTFSATQTADFQPSVEGIGLEAQVRYNTWQQFWHNIKELLGLAEDQNENEKKAKTPPVLEPETKKEEKQSK